MRQVFRLDPFFSGLPVASGLAGKKTFPGLTAAGPLPFRTGFPIKPGTFLFRKHSLRRRHASPEH